MSRHVCGAKCAYSRKRPSSTGVQPAAPWPPPVCASASSASRASRCVVKTAWKVPGACVRGKCVECAYSQVAGRNKRRRLLVFGAVCMASWQALALPRRCSSPLQCDGAASGLDAASGRGRRRPSVNQRSRHPEGPRQSCARAPRRPPPRGTPSKPATAPVSARAPARPQEFPFSPTHCAPPSH